MPVYSVTQVTTYVREMVERDSLLRDVWVSGEVTNLSRPGSGHSYFSLSDARGALRCVMFRDALGGERLANGSAVIAHGRVSLYQVRGDLQLIVDIVQPEGVGELQLRLEQLKLKLQKEGLFEPSRKRSLPPFPRRVGVITSPTGAVWHDIQTVVARRYPLAELLLAPTPVQGHEAVPGIVDAFGALDRTPGVDIVILARGGGSLEDLWSFNEEPVARAVFACRVPVVSAVGHETDVTVADLVADQRAPTPSAAAEMAVPDCRQLTARLLVAEQALGASVSGRLSVKTDALGRLRDRLGRAGPDLDGLRLRIDELLRRAARHLKTDLQLRIARLDGLERRLESLGPGDTLRRGYAIVQQSDYGAVVTDAVHLRAGDGLDITLSRGAVRANVASPAGGSGQPVETSPAEVVE